MLKFRPPSLDRWSWLVLIALISIFVGLRCWCWPLANEFRDLDELSYLHGGLLVTEGMQPPMRHTPAGPQTWLTFGLASGSVLSNLAHHATEAHSELAILQAIEKALFDLDRDAGFLRLVHLLLSNALAAAALICLFLVGRKKAGLAGAVTASGLYLFCPMAIDYGLVANPYSAAWSLGLLAFCFAALDSQKPAILGAGICLGLSVASRLEALLFFPFIFIELAQNHPELRWFNVAQRIAGIAFLVFAVAAPWFLASPMSGLRNAVVIGVFHSGAANGSRLARSGGFLLEQGWIIPFTLAFATTFWPFRRAGGGDRWRRLFVFCSCSVVMFLPARELRYELPLLLGLLPSLLLLLHLAAARSKCLPATLAGVILLGPIAASFHAAERIHRDRIADLSTGWIEQHIPAGEKVFLSYTKLQTLLPTRAAADRIWNDVRSTDAWRQKIGNAGSRLGFDSKAFPRAFTEEPMNLEIGNRRRWFILGSDLAPNTPRYDLQVSDSIVFGPQDMRASFATEGGLLVWRGEPLPQFGEPEAYWVSPSGLGVFIYRRPQVAPASAPGAL
jgi:hypothetical protein